MVQKGNVEGAFFNPNGIPLKRSDDGIKLFLCFLILEFQKCVHLKEKKKVTPAAQKNKTKT